MRIFSIIIENLHSPPSHLPCLEWILKSLFFSFFQNLFWIVHLIEWNFLYSSVFYSTFFETLCWLWWVGSLAKFFSSSSEKVAKIIDFIIVFLKKGTSFFACFHGLYFLAKVKLYINTVKILSWCARTPGMYPYFWFDFPFKTIINISRLQFTAT